MLSSILGVLAVPARLLLGHLPRLHNHDVHAVGSASKAVAWPCAMLHTLMGNAIVLMHLHALFSDTVLAHQEPPGGAGLFAATSHSQPALHGRLSVGLPDRMTCALVLFGSQLSLKIQLQLISMCIQSACIWICDIFVSMSATVHVTACAEWGSSLL